jgi:hypothetical protein
MGSQQATGTISGLLGDIVNDTMHFVDDLMQRVNEVEIDARNAVTDLVDVNESGGGSGSGNQDMDLRAALADLQSKVEALGSSKSKKSS